MCLIIFFFFLIIIFGILYFLFQRNFNYWLKYPQIPSADGKIFCGKFIEILTFKTNFGFHLKNIYEDENFNNEAIVGIYGLYKPSLLIREPDIIKTILIKNFHYFKNRSCRADDRNDRTGTLALFFSTYAGWKEMRQKLSCTFSSGKMKYMYPLLQKEGNRLGEYLQQKGERFTLELKEVCDRFTTDVISTTLMGFTSNALENDKEYIYQEAIKLSLFNLKRAFHYLIMFYAPKLNWLLRPKAFYASTERFMRSSLQCIMEERERTCGSRNDLIDAFVKIKKEAEQNGRHVENDTFIAHGCQFMWGGFDTSASTILNVLFELAKDTEVQNKLRSEIHLALKQNDGYISYESLNKMEYLQMVIDEILRLYPVLPFLDREYSSSSNENNQFTINPYYDYTLPDGMPVYISIYGLHYDPKYWPNPTKFDPERFHPDNKKSLNSMTYLPFGDGPRNCIGARLAMLMVKVGLIHFLKNHYVQVCAETVVKPTFEPKSIILQIKGGTHLEFVRDNMLENLEFSR